MARTKFDNMVGRVRVPVYHLASEIHDVGADLARSHSAADLRENPEDENEIPSIDCRLQVSAGSWCLHTGSADYDTDHRGYWGVSSIPRGCTRAEADRIAKDLIEQAGDDAAS